LKQENTDAELWSDYAKNPSAKNKEKIIKKYLPLTKYVVNRMHIPAPRGLDYEDLASFGVLGLLGAIDKYDHTKGFSFSTYAMPRIRGAVLDELRKFDWISRTGREKLQKLNMAIEKILRDKGRVDDELVMQEMSVDEKTYRETLALASQSYVVSLDETIAMEDGEVDIESTLPADDEEGAVAVMERQAEIDNIKAALSQLSEREIQIISFYYYEGLTFKEIAKVLEVTESRICQMHGKMMVKLRAMLKKATTCDLQL
jgi:RNA polymerase sigma factor for flagellar operon FliA